ncbi:MAG: class B sortase [Coriobacteriales bacterium]|nr:class B sortase [Coriobacteriales bacterium]
MAAYTPKHLKNDDKKPSEAEFRPPRREASGRERASRTDRSSRIARRSDSSRSSRRRAHPETFDGAGLRETSGLVEAEPHKTSRFHLSLALGIVFFVIALVIAVFLFYGSLSANQSYSSIKTLAGMDMEGAVAPDANMDDLKVNWEAIKAINSDIVGWIMIPDTQINYPIVQASDNEFYLTHLADKTSNNNGSIFLDSENNPALTDWNNIIYGHNLLNGSMFARLKAYAEQDFFDAHRTIFLSTPERLLRLQVDAALVCDADDKVRRFAFNNREDFNSYVGMLLDYAVINELAQGEIPENLYCFVTCTDTNYSKRTMILASVVETRDL